MARWASAGTIAAMVVAPIAFVVLAVMDARAERAAFIASCQETLPYWRCVQEWSCTRGDAIACALTGRAALKEMETSDD